MLKYSGVQKKNSPCLKFPPHFCQAKWTAHAQPIGPDRTCVTQLSSINFARPCIAGRVPAQYARPSIVASVLAILAHKICPTLYLIVGEKPKIATLGTDGWRAGAPAAAAGGRVLAGRGRDRRDRVYHGPHASLLDIGEFARVRGRRGGK